MNISGLEHYKVGCYPFTFPITKLKQGFIMSDRPWDWPDTWHAWLTAVSWADELLLEVVVLPLVEMRLGHGLCWIIFSGVSVCSVSELLRSYPGPGLGWAQLIQTSILSQARHQATRGDFPRIWHLWHLYNITNQQRGILIDSSPHSKEKASWGGLNMMAE